MSDSRRHSAQGIELELLTSQYYNFSACVFTQEGLHEVVAHREQFGSWRDTKIVEKKIVTLSL